MKQFIIITLCLLVSACGDKVFGEYGGDGCAYSKMDFRGNGMVYLTYNGREMVATYKFDGDRLIILSKNIRTEIFQINGDTLVGVNVSGSCKKFDDG